VARYSKGLRGLIALSPSIEPVVPIPAWKKKLAKFFSKFLPIVKFQSDIDPADFSHDENVVNSARKDPLMNWHVTARLGTEILKNLEQLPTMVFQVKVPCLFMHGGGDKICSIDATRKFYHSVLVQNKDFKTYSGFAHELLNETGREKVLRDIVSWISSQLIAFKRIARDAGRRAPNKEGQNYDQETADLWHSPDNSLHH
jgi:alpha-beta hydrolase superfamily lysophospholipase